MWHGTAHDGDTPATDVRFLTTEVAAATGGRVVGPDVAIDGAVIDSRLVVGGELFVPLVAERDGHDFISGALESGAAAYLTSRPPVGGTAVVVDDTTAALTALGRAARDRLPERVVGITGSVGKTSVKDLMAAAIGSTLTVVASERSFNNELGVPLTLLAAPEGCDAAVVEMGARGAGHIRLLCDIARPTVGVVTAVGLVHTETFGSLEAVARAKSELVADLPATATAVLNADDERVAAMASVTPATVVRYGLAHPGSLADVVAEAIVVDDELRPSFRLRSPWGDAEVRLAVRGHHQVANALAAVAGAVACGVVVDDAVAGLADAALSPWRMELVRTPVGALVVNDSYNANPVSVAAALRSLAALPARRRVAVLGTMAELGDVAEREHRAVAELAAELGIEVLAVGEPAYGVLDVADIEGAVAHLGTLTEGDAVLVKGSRVAGLEVLAERLVEGY
ncbi:MAG TPA: UDP-N-acetylmuramoyl-tripeptide--D-alanyl-D-alanine ligase [Acidimicrobiales bacterium]|nr:UDP-N-acetylmuramoyl-tripeptide--D-alanyl-D-alanine ligase [Acidimicrobiales bacterium]